MRAEQRMRAEERRIEERMRREQSKAVPRMRVEQRMRAEQSRAEEGGPGTALLCSVLLSVDSRAAVRQHGTGLDPRSQQNSSDSHLYSTVLFCIVWIEALV
jgi:hypothetical protein